VLRHRETGQEAKSALTVFSSPPGRQNVSPPRIFSTNPLARRPPNPDDDTRLQTLNGTRTESFALEPTIYSKDPEPVTDMKPTLFGDLGSSASRHNLRDSISGDFRLSPPTPRWIISLQTLTTHEHWVLAILSRHSRE
jgi:hypothetical protein